MHGTNHWLIGACIGTGMSDPLSALVVGLISHPVADTFIHPDNWQWRKLDERGRPCGLLTDPPQPWELPLNIADVLLGGILCLVAASYHPTHFWPMMAGGFGAFFPDSAYAPIFGPWLRSQPWYAWFHRLHEAMHFPVKPETIPWAWHCPAIALALSIWWLVISR